MKNKSHDDQINAKLSLVRSMIKKEYALDNIRAMMNFIRFYIRLPNEKMNSIFEKKVEEMVTNKNIPMGVEEIILQQAEERGLERGIQEGLEVRLYEIIKKLIIKGKSNQEICDLLDVVESLAVKIRKEIMG